MYFLRHAIALLVLPVTVVIVVPTWIWSRGGSQLAAPETALGWLLLIAGVAALGSGAALFVASLSGFGTKGEGTLAPWDPPANLVVQGPYAYVRNPMISGVVLLLVSEALILRSVPLGMWASFFAVISALHIPLIEEPGLRSRFGAEYEEYSRHVPRLVPRLSPWRR